jgi:hypothetical protein
MFTSVSFTTSWLYAGGLVLFGCASAVLVRACMVRGPVRSLFAVAPLRALGIISYGVYLYHWPIFLVLDQRRVGLDAGALFVVRVAATIAVALLSYVLVERPVRERRALRSWRLPAGLVGAAVAVALCAPLVGSTTSGQPSAAALRKVSVLPESPPRSPTSSSVAGPPVVPRPLRVYVVGDSVGGFFAVGLQHWSDEHPGTVVVYSSAKIACPISRGGSLRFIPTEELPSTACDATLDRWPADLRAFAPDVVIVGTATTNTVDRKMPGDSRWRVPGDPRLDAFQLAAMRDAADVLGATGVPVLWFDMPHEQRDGGTISRTPVLASSEAKRVDHYNKLLREFVASRPASRPVTILPWAHYFNTLPVEEDLAIRADGIHLLWGEQEAKLLDSWLWSEITDDYLAAKAPTGP